MADYEEPNLDLVVFPDDTPEIYLAYPVITHTHYM